MPDRGGSSDAVELWYVRTSEVSGADVLSACEVLLTPEENERSRALRFDQHRREYLVTRALSRAALSTYLGVPPSDLKFRRSVHGRPELDASTDLRFSLANTLGMVVCAVDVGHEVGVDTEPLSRARQLLGMAASVCTPTERERLARLSRDTVQAQAVRLWTLKEAYMKARGLGIAIPPESIQIEFDGARCRLDVLCAGDDDPDRWELYTTQIDDHVVGACIERGSRAEPRVLLRHADLRTMLRVDRA